MKDADDGEDSDADLMKRLITDSKKYDNKDEEDDDEASDVDEEEGEQEIEEDEESSGEEDEQMKAQSESEDSEAEKKPKNMSGKQALKKQIADEKKTRAKEADMRAEDGEGKQNFDINDYERLLQADKDSSYLWIQYMSFILDKLDIEAARRIAQRAVKCVSMTNEAEKLNIWVAYMNMES